MKQNKTIILAAIVIIAILAVITASMGLTNNITNTDGGNNTSSPIKSNLEAHAFDSYFTMNIPKNTSFEKTNGTTSGNISLYINYKDQSEKINVIYAEAEGGKEKLKQAYEDMAQNNANVTLKTINNATICI